MCIALVAAALLGCAVVGIPYTSDQYETMTRARALSDVLVTEL